MYFLIIVDVWGILFIYEISRFDYSFKPFQGCFGHFRGFGVILANLEILGLFWSIKWFRGVFVFWMFYGFGGFVVILVILGVYWSF